MVQLRRSGINAVIPGELQEILLALGVIGIMMAVAVVFVFAPDIIEWVAMKL